MNVDTKAARNFAEGGDRYTGAEVRLWVHNLADEVDRLRAELALNRMADDALALGLSYECHDGAKCSAPDAAMCASKCRRL